MSMYVWRYIKIGEENVIAPVGSEVRVRVAELRFAVLKWKDANAFCDII